CRAVSRAPSAAVVGDVPPTQPARRQLRPSRRLPGSVLPQRADLLRQADPVRGAVADGAVAGAGRPAVRGAFGALRARTGPGGAGRSHGVSRGATRVRPMHAVVSPVPAAHAGRYYDSALQTDAIKLLPADYVATGEPVALVTLLGSC